MRVEYINPFINSTLNMFKTMIGIMPVQGKPFLKKDAGATYDVSGVIGLTGQASGTVVVSFSNEAALSIVSAFIGMEIKSIDQDVTDAIGELTNMITGGAKAELNKFGFNIVISVPSVITGKDHLVSRPKDIPCISIPFTTEKHGNFSVDVSLKTPE